MAATFTALVLDEIDGKVTATLKQLGSDALPDGDVTVAISHSTLNYKDGMVLGGVGRLVRSYRMSRVSISPGRSKRRRRPTIRPAIQSC